MVQRRVLLIGAVAGLAGVTALGLWVLLSPNATDARPIAAGLTEITDPAEIEKLIQVPSLGLATGENYLGHRVRYVIGRVKNISTDRPIGLVEVKLTFVDMTGNPVHENVSRAYESLVRRLGPGKEHEFQIGFEDLPRTWNYRRPRLQVTRVAY